MPDIWMNATSNTPVAFLEAQWVLSEWDELQGMHWIDEETQKVNAAMRERMKNPLAHKEKWFFYKMPYAVEVHYHGSLLFGGEFQANKLDDLLEKIRKLPTGNY